MTWKKSCGRKILSSSDVSTPNFVFNFNRPTREKSYFWALKNMFSNSVRELSSVGGSPGRIRR